MLNENILSKNENYIIACSAGPDSMFLLNNLVKLKYLNIIPVHINYNKRKDSKNDEIIFKNYCEANKLNSYIKKISDDDYKKIKNINNDKNFQSLARIIRYDFFYTLAKKYNAKILIAHNQNDLIETYLLQKKRKSIVSYYGLKEITYYGELKIEILRPMLNIKKTEILNYLKKENIKYAIDYTNDLSIYNRNKIRKNINEKDFDMYIKKINYENFLLKEEEKKLKKYYNIIVDENIIYLKKFFELDVILQQKLLYNYFANNSITIFFKRKKQFLNEILKQIISNKPNIIIKLDNNFSFLKEYNKAYILKNELLNIKEFYIEIKDIKNFYWNNYKISFFKNKNLIDIKLVNGYYCYLDKSELPIIITNKEKYFRDIKIGSKSIKKILSKEKIPLIKRTNPIIISNNKKILVIPKYKTIATNQNKEYLMIISNYKK